ncbi:MAG: homoserine O-acetyltransferase [Candidatus Odinarchaeum yellowstonii]|uniref:Homoserine O-acetyltransferase n=1 Tax=Odinarchaeota yellowstonii (strain LCB_4) TaxID=1841599 RepID=A0AAF0D1W7_ODILC|nr:MAG: homoserine O-acetyltransferase [Candidatus Odinarchaeum yellowstonii]
MIETSEYEENTVGLVETKYITFEEGVQLSSGVTLKPITVAYETYGELNKDKSNAILVEPTLTADAHVAGVNKEGQVGWWDMIVGPNKALDTYQYFVICTNVLGGCKGTTGPSSINPKTKKPYGVDFPVITIEDMVKVQKMLIDYFGIKKLYAVIGGSMGGMQVLQWLADYPEYVRKAIVIATSARNSAMCIAFNQVGRVAIMSDPNWNGGDYYDKEPPRAGLALARMIGHITYLSDSSMREKFGRKLQGKESYGYDFNIEFQVESYLQYKGTHFVKRFDANSYLYLTRAVDYFDLTNNGKRSLAEAFKNVKSKVLVIGITSDWLYPTYQQKEIVLALTANNVDVTYQELESDYGHDAFLVEKGQMNYIIKNFLSKNKVRDIMTKGVKVLKPQDNIETAARIMINESVTHLPVVDENNQLVGIVTSWDLCKAITGHYSKIEEVMTRNVITVNFEDDIHVAANKMKKYDFSALPVLDNENKLVGMINVEAITTVLGKIYFP